MPTTEPTTAEQADALSTFLRARLAVAEALAGEYHHDDCALLHRLERLSDARCDCSAEETITERVNATETAVAMLQAASTLLAVAVLTALAAPWRDHPDYPAASVLTAAGVA